ncbi:beta-glucosidase-like glycosyl hydrolase/CubicO group peptidase (beta-lactamase class C family) [Hymenobacter luteus]|uniref:beta-N-acetylhexosaminidase n=2 Tax=Hymenobacter TaxID=89966 RepID=A0A7W9T055_9BACT|nr:MULTISPECIES: glycoside hydrolase family 3 N-terminal domain-containing protein [Hymenobacter]MBB4600647.1 beta-glucosidase-like glycosyl hydrolase/CubicO group peptidase (beta-lactamase class C family) [Hymenobacter latericoloratus]MBB6059146.1 beta-glucosidase-like glycosyl hydrolase/CubicO group peptidase (beta-lactamase class C family) [Hymenobacter luteus]
MLKDFRIGIFLLVLAVTGLLISWSAPREEGGRPMSVAEQNWVDSVFTSLTPDQRLGQLFMVAAYSNKDRKHAQYTEFLIKNYNIGGLMFLQGGPRRQANLTNRYQAAAKVPLLVAMDAEWGLDMRLDSSMHFAKGMTLGAMDDDQYVYQMGREIALKMKTLGVHVSFSPVIDVNSNPSNPVIGNRSFGENKEQVAKRGISYIRGLQDHGVMAVVKHFPGHGDTDVDSHVALPVINSDMARLTNVDLYPFQKSFEQGVMGVMVGHLYMPLFDTVRTLSATISKNLVTGLLKEKMNYRGLVFTDALNMKSVSTLYKPGELDALALAAGNDVLLFSEDVPMALQKIKEFIAEGKVDQADIDQRVRKVLRAKYWAGLNRYQPVDVPNLMQNLNRPLSRMVQQQIYEHATTVVKNEDDLLPFLRLDTLRIAAVTIGSDAPTYKEIMGKYQNGPVYAVPNRYAVDSTFARIAGRLAPYNVVVVSLHNMNNTPTHNYGIGEGALKFLKDLQANPRIKTVVVAFGNAYSLKYLEGNRNLVCGYEDNYASQLVVPQVLFGALPAKGRLPVTVSENLKAGTGLPTPDFRRLRYGTPEEAGLDSRILSQIDNVALEAVAYAAAPGCQVLVAKDGMVVFDKSYGYCTYDKSQPVNNSTLYDLASVTKVAGTLQAIMYLKDQGKLNLDERVATYLPELKSTNKKDMTVREVLMHQAGLKPGIPTWEKTVTKAGPKPTFYASTESPQFSREVTPELYSLSTSDDSVWTWVQRSGLLPKVKGKYPVEYSDLSFIILKRVAEKVLKEPIDGFLQRTFYQPLGLGTMTYNPLSKFPKSCIAPTENDTYYRRTLLQGTVHDQTAAMIGGVGGHAGLFSNANDLAVLMQMNLQNGRYGGQRYFQTPVVTEFARSTEAGNRRGLGWDKGDPSKPEGPTSNLSPASTFGHTGFTGTCVWMDPENKILYIFLSNRVYPDAGNNKLRQYNIRTRIHDVIYKSLQKT